MLTLWKRIVDFFKGVRNELTYVQWPDRKQTLLTTLAVFLFVVVTTLYLAGVDFVISHLLRWILQ